MGSDGLCRLNRDSWQDGQGRMGGTKEDIDGQTNEVQGVGIPISGWKGVDGKLLRAERWGGVCVLLSKASSKDWGMR